MNIVFFQVLMRALRDFNIPKIITDDMSVFMGLIGDLFPALDVPRKRDIALETQIKTAITDQRLQAEDSFILKVNIIGYQILNLKNQLNFIFTVHLCLYVKFKKKVIELSMFD